MVAYLLHCQEMNLTPTVDMMLMEILIQDSENERQEEHMEVSITILIIGYIISSYHCSLNVT